MPDKDPTNYTVKEILTEFILPAIEEVKQKQDLTNGRITKLEAWKNKGVGIVSLIVLVLIPITITTIAAFH